MDSTKDIRVLSICAGYGGIELALERSLDANLKIVTVEIESYAVANLVAKAEQNKMAIIANYTDVKSFPSEKFRGCFDIITAGFPCQPFSTAGKRLGGYDPRHLWPHITEHIRAIRPVCVYLENVPGLLSARTLDNRPDLQRHLAKLGKAENGLNAKDRWRLSRHRERLAGYFLRQEGVQAYGAIYYGLRDMGYKVEAGLFTAAEVGAPHKRERLFVLAYSENNRPSIQRDTDNYCQRGISDVTSKKQPSIRGKAERSDRGIQPELANPESVTGGLLIPKRRQNQTVFESVGTSQGFPARPGQPQYEWEEPRTVKSGMGRTVNGFKSRVDELRLLGNGVVPQTAALAWKTLRDLR